jgi:hypothetical protein
MLQLRSSWGIGDSLVDRVNQLAAAEDFRPGDEGKGGVPRLWAILAGVALLFALVTASHFLRFVTYQGPVRWGASYSTITLVRDGRTVPVTARTWIQIDDERVSFDQLQDGSRTSPARDAANATVEYRPAPLGAVRAITIE